MPTSTSSTWPRNHQPSGSTYSTPARQSGAHSPSLSAYSFSQTATPAQSKSNIVTRVAIEGKAKKDQEGASVKMYLKLAIPLDTLTSTTIPLFAEENIKILTSQVHPLDTNSAPYNFSSTTSPLLNKGARALNLPNRLPQGYHTQFQEVESSSIPSYNRASSSSKSVRRLASQDHTQPLELNYTGHITISEYQVVFVLPRELPPQKNDEGDNEESYLSRINPTSSPTRRRRHSIVDRNAMQFMVAIDMWVPFVTKPPRAPYLLCIPTPPRCLHNQIRLRIFPPPGQSTSNSFASLSSVEEDAWDINSDPYVSRAASRQSRTATYNDLADDESSDSSTLADGSGIQGTFPSADRIRIRWAKPTRNIFNLSAADTRRRVGVDQSSGEMTCSVLDKLYPADGRPGGVVMHIEYKGSVKGVWYPGVATLLGLDVSLESKGLDVTWAPDSTTWTVNAGAGYTGWSSASSRVPMSRQVSVDSTSMESADPVGTRQDSGTSLLRAPLPGKASSEYSFEESSLSGTLSSPSSLTPSAVLDTARSSFGEQDSPPGAPITLHINIDDLTAAKGAPFTYTISGTILISPRQTTPPSRRHSLGANSSDDPVGLPKFTVLAANRETTSWIVRNDVEPDDVSTVNVEVYTPSGDIRDAQSKKTVLQKGSSTRCGDDGARIMIRSVQPTSRPKMSNLHGIHDTAADLRNGIPRTPSSMVLRPHINAIELRPKVLREGPLMIPWAIVTVTPILAVSPVGSVPCAHSVQLSLPVVTQKEDEWFVLEVHQPKSTEKEVETPPIDFVCASVDGVPLQLERSLARKRQSRNEMVTELKAKTGCVGSVALFEYIVKHANEGDGVSWDLLLPSLPLAVGRLEVILECPVDHTMKVASNMQEVLHNSGHKLVHWSLEKGFRPSVQISLKQPAVIKNKAFRFPIKNGITALGILSSLIMSLIILFAVLSMDAEFRLMKQALQNRCPAEINRPWPPPQPETRTVTSTMFIPTPAREHTTSTTESVAQQSSPPPVPLASVIDIRHTTPETPRPAPTQDSVPTDENSLAHPYELPFKWTIQFDLPPVAQEAAEIMLRGLEKAYQIFRQMYHFPLGPPP